MPGVYDAYDKAHKLALNCYEKNVEEHKDPYLPVLDQILQNVKIKKEVRQGIREIPLKQVIGTKTEGRTRAFASNFMPLLEPNSEFADKWMNLYNSQLEEGIRDPIKAYELFGSYYVQEGNKRVSVLKFCKSPSIVADVREVIVDTSRAEPDKSRLYQKYLEFKKLTGMQDLVLSSAEQYSALMKLLKTDEEHPLSPVRQKDLKSLYTTFMTVLDKSDYMARVDYSSPDNTIWTPGDAFLSYLKVYGFTPDTVVPQSEMTRELDKLFAVAPETRGTYVMVGTEASERKKGVLSSLLSGPLKVAFILSKDSVSSRWTAEHETAVHDLEESMEGEIKVELFTMVNTQEQAIEALNKAVKDGCEVVFTTHPLMLQAANQFQAKYPKLKILNCSLNLETGLLRTYYAREYEIQFLMGVLAGVLTATNRIGYLASYPINGTVAAINAFALGVEMTNPSAKIYLDWTTTKESTLKSEPLNTDILYIEGNQFDPKTVEDRRYGLFDVGRGKFFNLASIKHNWSVFYEKIVKSILNGSWEKDQQKSGYESITYWWGLSNGLLDLEFSDKLPLQTRRLVSMLARAMKKGEFMPFEGQIKDQSGHVHDWTHGVFLPHVATMDWLADNIVGVIPKEKQLVDDAKTIVALHGVDKVKEPDPAELEASDEISESQKQDSVQLENSKGTEDENS